MVNYYPNENNNLSQNIEEEANLFTNTNKCIKNNICPDVEYKNGNYSVNIEKNSKLAKILGYHGLKNYGNKRGVAKHI